MYIGDLNAASNLNFLCSCNIRTVITAALGFDQLDYQDLPIKHIVYPLLDSNQQDIAQFFAEFYLLMERQIRVGNVLVHCSAGISRVPSSSPSPPLSSSPTSCARVRT